MGLDTYLQINYANELAKEYNKKISNPTDFMTRKALKEHGLNTLRNMVLWGVSQIPLIGAHGLAGYITRQVGDGYIDCVKRRWNDVSVVDSRAKKFLKRVSSPINGLWDLLTGGTKDIYDTFIDGNLYDEEIGKKVANGYDQTSMTVLGCLYGWLKIIKKNNYYVNPTEINFSQNSAGCKWRYQIIKESMIKNGWKGEPIYVIETIKGFFTIDNTRVDVARELGIEKIPLKIHKMTDYLP